MPNNYDLSGRVALITGALGGLGPATVRAFIQAGATVDAVGRASSQQQHDALRASLGPDAERLQLHTADVLNEQEVAALVDGIVAARGHLDIAVNLVGGYAAGQPVTETNADVWQSMHDLNLQGTILVSKYAARAMQRGSWGRILNISSRAAYSGRKNAAAYAVTKAAVLTLTEAQAEELKGANITVNAVVPGTIDTPANRAAMPNANFARWPKPEDLARVLVFLATDDAWLISGAAIPVYGQS